MLYLPDSNALITPLRGGGLDVQEVLGLKPHFTAGEVRGALQELAQLESALRA